MVVGEMVEEVDVVVIGAGPGGYTAAIEARELGHKVMLVDRRKLPGGVCLQEGCIPSKSLLHCSHLIFQAKEAKEIGIEFLEPKIDLISILKHKNGVINKLTNGLLSLFKMHKVDFIDGDVTFIDDRNLRVDRSGESSIRVKFKNAIIATGSSPAVLPSSIEQINIKDTSKILNSTSALELKDIPKELLVIGGGYIGLELGQVYAGLGSKVSVVEFMDQLLPGVDADLVRPLANKMKSICHEIMIESKVRSIEEKNNRLHVSIQTKDNQTITKVFDKILVSIGRTPNTATLNLDKAGIKLEKGGFIAVNEYCQTSAKRIYAIGDVVASRPMLAHKAMREGHVVAQKIAGFNSSFDNVAIPCVVYTDPEIAWCGVTEKEANQLGLKFEITKMPWGASGRALSVAASSGLTKILYEKESKAILGCGIVGVNSGELIGQVVVAMEMGACIEDLANSILPHPTLSESIMESAQSAFTKHLKATSKLSSPTLVNK